MKRWVVLGSNSFSASHFISLLLSEGRHVLGISRSPEIHQVFRAYGWQLHSGTWDFVQADLNDASAIKAAVDGFRPQVVVNFAAQSMVAQSWASPEDWYQTNVVALARLANVLMKLPGLTRYVHVTTPEVYGSTEGWIRESFDFSPSTPYAVSRAAGDWHLMALHEAYGFPVSFTRAANVFGPGQQLYRIVPRALLSARLGRKLPLEGGGLSVRSFIHIEDVARATLLVGERGQPGHGYHISTNELVTIRELVERIAAQTGVEFAGLVEIAEDRAGKDTAYMLDSSRIRNELGWTPAKTLEQGLSDTLSWVDENIVELAGLPDTYLHQR